tara:strand:- start:221 stop:592 length:372 start_codon:yes stop_codon:yes gene_type:complete
VVRLVGVDLPNKKKVEYALRVIHGIGATTAGKIVQKLQIDRDLLAENLSNEQIILLRETLESPELLLEGDLRRYNGLNIKRLNDINCHRGKRHRTSLPVRGQRTRTNARSRRGSKKTVSSKKK